MHRALAAIGALIVMGTAAAAAEPIKIGFAAEETGGSAGVSASNTC
ncbi:MAG: hypothetical protein ACREFQ_04550 [Stellaceae bacterium]